MATFTELPLDIILLIADYLDVPSFLALTRTCHDLACEDIINYSHYWSTAVRQTFRVPNQPVVAHDGRRWKQLYRRLLNQTRPYTWGNNERGNLGHGFDEQSLVSMPPAARMGRVMVNRTRWTSWPTPIDDYGEYGIISDLQAGGWSTSFLTASGGIYTAGTIDGLASTYSLDSRPKPLSYPPGYSYPYMNYDPATAIKQFSSGRAHVLGLSDDGKIWSWCHSEQAGVQVKLISTDMWDYRLNQSNVKKVVAGWSKSAALVRGSGIVVWDALNAAEVASLCRDGADTAMVLESAIVPFTTYQRDQTSTSHSPGPVSPDAIGEVTSFIVLSDSIVFSTHLGKAFVSRITWTQEEQSLSTPQEILLDDAHKGLVTDVQGSHCHYAIFTSTDHIFTGYQDPLLECIQAPTGDTAPLRQIPALQNKNVISLAMGDHHFMALHKDGRITSYGTESGARGSFGLGGNRDPEGNLRGIRYQAFGGDGKLVRHAYSTGRTVWFEPEKRQWIRYLASGGHDPEEASERMRMCAERNVQAEVSEWIEQYGNAWNDIHSRPQVARSANIDSTDRPMGTTSSATADDSENEDIDAVAPYFALSITAAGWHSGALVLVDEDAAARISENTIIRNSPIPYEPASPPQVTPPTTTAPESGPGITGILYNAVTGLGQILGLTSPTTDPPVPGPANADSDAGLTEAQRTGRVPPTPRPQPASRPLPPTASAARPRVPIITPPRLGLAAPPPPPGLVPRAFRDPMNHGAAPNRTDRYVWTDMPFPRLQLDDGRVMPGTVGLTPWRSERPSWDLQWQGYE